MHVDSAHPRKHRCGAAGISRSLQQRSRSFQLPRSDQARCRNRAHGDSAAGERLVAAVDFQHRRERPRAGIQTARRSRGDQAGGKAFHIHRQARGASGLAQREYDHAQYLHQVPGGMISNLRHQLRALGMEDRLEEALEEAGRVRAECGYPIMVTPLAQFVGSQAAINIITGERYEDVTDQSIQYALGHWGKEAPRVMDSNIKDKILNRPRTEAWRNWSPPDLSLVEVRKKFGGPGVSDEELILRVIAGKAAVKAMLTAGAPREYVSATQPLVKLIGELVKRKDCNQVYIRKGEMMLRLGRKLPAL